MAKKKLKFNKDEIYGNWKLLKNKDHGGNSSVWKAEQINTKEQRIIKLLKKTHTTARQRFRDEIKIIKENQNIRGVMRIIDSSKNEDDILWYVMPEAVPLDKHLKGKSIIYKVDAVIEIAKILSELHSKEISHRDIKPQNLFFYIDYYVIGDFGLVDYPEKEDGLTIAKNALGPRWTIAPEMRNQPENSDGLNADVYSLSKTLWILLTNVENGFEGQYSPTGSIGISNYGEEIYLTILEDLLVQCTENNPELRPSINDFVKILTKWRNIQNDFYSKNNLDWKTVQYKLFPYTLPAYAEWTDIQTICDILNILGEIRSLNHMFFEMGGLDLRKASLSKEEGCIEIEASFIHIVKPKKLSFNSFNADLEWNCFYLELEDVKPIFESYQGHYGEPLVELESGQYKPEDFINNYYERYDDGFTNPPKKYRNILRQTGGNFAIFRKTSSYNLTPTTYDGRHSKMGANKFRRYIQHLVDIGYKAEYIRDENNEVLHKYVSHDIDNWEDKWS